MKLSIPMTSAFDRVLNLRMEASTEEDIVLLTKLTALIRCGGKVTFEVADLAPTTFEFPHAGTVSPDPS